MLKVRRERKVLIKKYILRSQFKNSNR